jgi:hypothetical protein
VSLVRAFQQKKLLKDDFDAEGELHIIGAERPTGANRFRAVCCPVGFKDKGVALPADAKKVLGLKSGARVSLIPFA